MTQTLYLRKGSRWVSAPVEDRFWSKVVKSDGCWLWSGCVDRNGYAYLKIGSRKDGFKMVLCHRLSWKIHFGEVPTDLDVLHRCDVRNCMNPSHLFLGTHADNMSDRDKKGRGNQPKGEENGLSRLTAAQVREIRASYCPGKNTQKFFADKFGVCKATIGHILSRRNWKHL